MNSALSRESISLFESIKQYDENGNEYWTSRNLSRVLEYADYRNFIKVIEKAKTACANSGQVETDHFVDITEMVIIGSGAPRNIDSIEPVEYAIFQNYGYQGLYGGLGAKDIHARKGLKKNEKILDHMGSTELAANLFRATQTEEKLRRENIHGKAEANRTHYQVGAKVRQTIKELGGTMPEDLPVAESIKIVEKKKKQLKAGTSELPNTEE